jgi:DNA polymerase lambda
VSITENRNNFCCVDKYISIGSFSMRLGSRKKQRIQEILPPRHQQRLELRPVSDVAQLLGKMPERASGPPTSPIEDISFVPATSSREAMPDNLIYTDPTARIAKHAIKHATKQNDKPLKRPTDRTATTDRPAGEVAPAAEGSTSCITPPPQLQINDPVAAISSKIVKKEDKIAKKTTTEKQKLKGKKAKPQLITPVEYARVLHGKAAATRTNNSDEERSSKIQKQRKRAVKFLAGKNVFYTGGDMKYASETTRGRMDIVCEQFLLSISTF